MLTRRDVIRLLGAASLMLAGVGRGTAQASRIVEEPWIAEHLSGTLCQPAGDSVRGPMALIVAGSGPTNRDGSINTYRLLAHGLAAAGIPSLRYDKRGVGQSRPQVAREDELVFEHFVADAALAARDLARRPEVSSVVIIGHSEGALIATLVAARMPLAGIALLAPVGRRMDEVLREQLLAMTLPASLEHIRREALDTLDRLARGERVKEVSAENGPLFRPSVQPFLLSVFAIDPAAELAKLRLPVMLVRGQSDIQVGEADLDLLRQARPDARVLVLPETNHGFKAAPADITNRAAQLRSYDPAAPLVPGLVPAVADFIRSVAG